MEKVMRHTAAVVLTALALLGVAACANRSVNTAAQAVGAAPVIPHADAVATLTGRDGALVGSAWSVATTNKASSSCTVKTGSMEMGMGWIGFVPSASVVSLMNTSLS